MKIFGHEAVHSIQIKKKYFYCLYSYFSRHKAARKRSGPCWGIGDGPQQADFTGFRGGEKWKIASCVPRNTAHY